MSKLDRIVEAGDNDEAMAAWESERRERRLDQQRAERLSRPPLPRLFVCSCGVEFVSSGQRDLFCWNCTTSAELALITLRGDDET